MTWRRHAAIGTAIAAIAAACSSFDEPPATPDVADGGDAGSIDAPSTVEDGSAVPDAAAETRDGEAKLDASLCVPPSPSGCASPVIAKLDFTPELFPAGWTADEDEGTVTRVAKPGPCSPADGFLRANTKIPNDAEASGNAYLAQAFNGSYGSAHVVFAFRGPEPLTGGYANLGCTVVFRGTASPQPRTSVRLTLSDDNLEYGASVRAVDGGVQLTGGKIELDQTFGANAKAWHRIDARFAITANAVTVTTTYDGKAYSDFQAQLLTPATRIEIECGIDYSDGANATYQHDIDDVFFELCPAQ